jgi:hypothetical protein
VESRVRKITLPGVEGAGSWEKSIDAVIPSSPGRHTQADHFYSVAALLTIMCLKGLQLGLSCATVALPLSGIPGKVERRGHPISARAIVYLSESYGRRSPLPPIRTVLAVAILFLSNNTRKHPRSTCIAGR